MRDEILLAQAIHKSELDEENEADSRLFELPRGKGFLSWVEWFFGWPGRFALAITIPDARDIRFRKFYPLTFFMCIIWIGAMSYFVSWLMTVIGYTFRIPDSVMGLTFIAAGTSVPEAISSIIVARQGLGTMGISNSIGSNTFDILICLGLPWLIRSSIIANEEFNYIQIKSGGLEYSAITLLGSLFLFYGIVAANRYYLDKKIGMIALTTYACFLVFASLLELNVFFTVNLPTCEREN